MLGINILYVPKHVVSRLRREMSDSIGWCNANYFLHLWKSSARINRLSLGPASWHEIIPRTNKMRIFSERGIYCHFVLNNNAYWRSQAWLVCSFLDPFVALGCRCPPANGPQWPFKYLKLHPASCEMKRRVLLPIVSVAYRVETTGR